MDLLGRSAIAELRDKGFDPLNPLRLVPSAAARVAFVAALLIAGFAPAVARADFNPPAENAPAASSTLPPVAPDAASAQAQAQVVHPAEMPQQQQADPNASPVPIPVVTPGAFEQALQANLHLPEARHRAYTIGSAALVAFTGLMVCIVTVMALFQMRDIGHHIGDLLVRSAQAYGMIVFMAMFANIVQWTTTFACRTAVGVAAGQSVILSGNGNSGTCTDFNFTSMFVYGLEETTKLIGAKAFGVPLILAPGIGDLIKLAAFGTFIAFTFIGLENLAITLEFLVVGAFGPVLLMFQVFEPLRHLAEGPKTYPISVAFRYFFNWLFIAIGISAFTTLDAAHGGFQGLTDVLMVVMGVLAWVWLIARMGRTAKTLLDGQSRWSAAQEFVKPALDTLARLAQVAVLVGGGGPAGAAAVEQASSAMQNALPTSAGAGGGGGGGGFGGPSGFGGGDAPLPPGGGTGGLFGLGDGRTDFGEDPMDEIAASTPPPALTGANAERRSTALGAQSMLALPPPPPPIAASATLGSSASGGTEPRNDAAHNSSPVRDSQAVARARTDAAADGTATSTSARSTRAAQDAVDRAGLATTSPHKSVASSEAEQISREGLTATGTSSLNPAPEANADTMQQVQIGATDANLQASVHDVETHTAADSGTAYEDGAIDAGHGQVNGSSVGVRNHDIAHNSFTGADAPASSSGAVVDGLTRSDGIVNAGSASVRSEGANVAVDSLTSPGTPTSSSPGEASIGSSGARESRSDVTPLTRAERVSSESPVSYQDLGMARPVARRSFATTARSFDGGPSDISSSSPTFSRPVFNAPDIPDTVMPEPSPAGTHFAPATYDHDANSNDGAREGFGAEEDAGPHSTARPIPAAGHGEQDAPAPVSARSTRFTADSDALAIAERIRAEIRDGAEMAHQVTTADLHVRGPVI